MATVRAFEPAPAAVGPSRPRPLSSADEQARILRAVVAREPDGLPLALEAGFALEAWERDLLWREARFSRDVRGEALTLLRARAAEWAVRRRLERPAALDAAGAEAAGLLLDRTLADIGAATDTTLCHNPAGLEAAATRLEALYERLSETSLRLACGRGGEAPRPWCLAELGDDEFEIEAAGEIQADLARARERRPVPGAAPATVPADDDLFEIEEIQRALALESRAPSAPSSPMPDGAMAHAPAPEEAAPRPHPAVAAAAPPAAAPGGSGPAGRLLYLLAGAAVLVAGAVAALLLG